MPPQDAAPPKTVTQRLGRASPTTRGTSVHLCPNLANVALPMSTRGRAERLVQLSVPRTNPDEPLAAPPAQERGLLEIRQRGASMIV
jgi:hypothetical protein